MNTFLDEPQLEVLEEVEEAEVDLGLVEQLFSGISPKILNEPLPVEQGAEAPTAVD